MRNPRWRPQKPEVAVYQFVDAIYMNEIQTYLSTFFEVQLSNGTNKNVVSEQSSTASFKPEVPIFRLQTR